MTTTAPASPLPGAEPTQRIVKIRRDYSTWMASETIGDHAPDPRDQPFTATMRQFAARVQLDAMAHLVRKAACHDSNPT